MRYLDEALIANTTKSTALLPISIKANHYCAQIIGKAILNDKVTNLVHKVINLEVALPCNLGQVLVNSRPTKFCFTIVTCLQKSDYAIVPSIQ